MCGFQESILSTIRREVVELLMAGQGGDQAPMASEEDDIWVTDPEEVPIIYLYQYSRNTLLPSLSPTCLKVETWLRLAGLKYKNVDNRMLCRSKKGQLPIVELEGEDIAHNNIIKQLGLRFQKDLDADLSNDQKIMSDHMTSTIENHMYWVLAWWRSNHPDEVITGYRINLQHAQGSWIPNIILKFIYKFVYARSRARVMRIQGMGTHSPNEMNEFAHNDLKLLSEVLADKPFFFGDKPATLDVSVFSILAQVHFISQEVRFPLRDYVQVNCTNLVGHVYRMKDMCFPDWEDICKTGSQCSSAQ